MKLDVSNMADNNTFPADWCPVLLNNCTGFPGLYGKQPNQSYMQRIRLDELLSKVLNSAIDLSNNIYF